MITCLSVFGFSEEAYIGFFIVLLVKLMRSVELKWLLMWYKTINLLHSSNEHFISLSNSRTAVCRQRVWIVCTPVYQQLFTGIWSHQICWLIRTGMSRYGIVFLTFHLDNSRIGSSFSLLFSQVLCYNWSNNWSTSLILHFVQLVFPSFHSFVRK